MFTKQIELSELNYLTVGQSINGVCKVLNISSPQEINAKNNTLKLHTVNVGDAKGCTKLAIWEDHVGKFESDKTYKI
jgi:hypothetical protein